MRVRPVIARCLATAACVVLASAAAAQSAVVDEATFLVTRNGAPAGRESFRIVRAPGPGGQVYRAQANSALGEDRISTTLATDSTGAPVSYELILSQRGEVKLHIQGRGRPNRFSVLSQTKLGEEVQEYMLGGEAVVIDEDVFHHLYFLPLAAKHGDLTVVVPRTSQQTVVSMEARGNENLSVGGMAIRARHVAVVSAAGTLQEAWLDDAGRLLKVSIPSKGMVAIRDDPPRRGP